MSKGAVAFAVLAGVALALLFRGEKELQPAAVAAPAEEVPAKQPFAHTEQAAVASPQLEPAMAAIAASLGAHLGRSSDVERAIADAHAGTIDAVELGRRLRETTAGHHELGSGLLRALAAERSPELALQEARALAGLEDDASLRAETIAALRASTGDTGMLALLGRGEEDVVQLATEKLASGSSESRATAAFLLNNAPGGAPAEARATAREALGDPGAGTRLREESATMLGQPGASEADLAALERAIFSAEPAVRMRALAALDMSGADPARLRADFERVAQDANAPERLLAMAQVWRATHR